jgi:hypothetical protein
MLWLTIWSIIEPGLGITAGSLATLRPLIRTIARWMSSRDTETTIDSTTELQSPVMEIVQSKQGPHIVVMSSKMLTSIEEEHVTHVRTPPDSISSMPVDQGQQGSTAQQQKRRMKGTNWLRWRLPLFSAGLMTEMNHAMPKTDETGKYRDLERGFSGKK